MNAQSSAVLHAYAVNVEAQRRAASHRLSQVQRQSLSRNQHRYAPYSQSNKRTSTASPAVQSTQPVQLAAYAQHQPMLPVIGQQQPVMQSHPSMQFPQSLAPQFNQAAHPFGQAVATPAPHHANPAAAAALQTETAASTAAKFQPRLVPRAAEPLDAPAQTPAGSAPAASVASQPKTVRPAAAERKSTEPEMEPTATQDVAMPDAQSEDTRPDIPVPPPTNTEPELSDTRTWEERTALTPDEIEALLP